MKLSQLMVATGVAIAGLVGFGGAAHAAPVSSAGPAACVAAGSAGDVSAVDPAAEASQAVSTQIPCDPLVCADGVLSVVTDDSGVQHQACVASAADAVVVPQRAALASPSPRTSTTTQANLPVTGAGTSGLIIAAVLVGSGSVVSLLSRRRPATGRKRFRRRGATP